MNNREIIAKASALLCDRGIADFNISAVRIAEYCLGKPLYLADNFLPEQLQLYNSLISKRLQKVPLQHILGKVNFRYLELFSSKDAFIARPETELIVDYVIDYVSSVRKNSVFLDKTLHTKDNIDFALPKMKVVDLCTGSGNIAISIANEIENTDVFAVEISPEAIAVAEQNNLKYGNKVKIIHDDATSTSWVNTYGIKDNVILGSFDCVVSNPPYIPSNRVFDNEVSYDPKIALYGGDDKGLYIPRKIVDVAAKLLKKGGLFVIEHDDTHQEELCEYIKGKNFSTTEPMNDLNGYPRFIKAIY